MRKRHTLVHTAGVLFYGFVIMWGVAAHNIPVQIGPEYTLHSAYGQAMGIALPGCTNPKQAVHSAETFRGHYGQMGDTAAVFPADGGYLCSFRREGVVDLSACSPYETGVGRVYISTDIVAGQDMAGCMANIMGSGFAVEYADERTLIVSFTRWGRRWQAGLRATENGTRLSVASPALDGDF